MKKIKIKICGQTNPAIIEHCLNIGVNQQGLIFYDRSPRNLDNDTLKIIHQYFQQFQDIFVGVFVTGIFLINFGQFIPAWDSGYYKLLMSQNIPYKEYLQSKYLLMRPLRTRDM